MFKMALRVFRWENNDLIFNNICLTHLANAFGVPDFLDAEKRFGSAPIAQTYFQHSCQDKAS